MSVRTAARLPDLFCRKGERGQFFEMARLRKQGVATVKRAADTPSFRGRAAEPGIQSADIEGNEMRVRPNRTFKMTESGPSELDSGFRCAAPE